MSEIKFLLRFLKRNILKNIIIIIQIVISIYVLTFVLVELISHFETSRKLSQMNLQNKIIFLESLHINTLLPGEERTQKYSDVKEYLRSLDGVKNVSSTYYTQLKNQDFNTYMYDKELINNLFLNLEEGKQFKEIDLENTTIPIVISETLKNEYPLDSIKELAIYNEKFDGETKFKVKVIGILKQGEYVYIGSSNQGIPELNDLFIKTYDDEKFILMPNMFKDKNISYFTNGGFIIEYDDKEDFFKKSYQKVIDDGIGKFSKIEDLENNFYSNLITNYDLYIFLFAITYIFVIASIGGYNLLETLNYKRLLTIYYITGMRWKKGILLIAIRNLLLIMIPTVVSSILFNKSLSEGGEYVFNSNVVLITCTLYFIVFLITTFGSIITLKNTKPIEILKEVE